MFELSAETPARNLSRKELLPPFLGADLFSEQLYPQCKSVRRLICSVCRPCKPYIYRLYQHCVEFLLWEAEATKVFSFPRFQQMAGSSVEMAETYGKR